MALLLERLFLDAWRAQFKNGYGLHSQDRLSKFTMAGYFRMKISELMEKLGELQGTHGDIEVVTVDDGECYYEPFPQLFENPQGCVVYLPCGELLATGQKYITI